MQPENTYDTKKIILAGIIVLLLVGLIGFLIIRKNNQDNQAADQKNLFPFGNGVTPNGSSSGTGTEPAPLPNPVSQNPLTVSSADRLRIISNYPVTDFYPLIQNKIVSEPVLDQKTNQSVLVSKQIPTNYVRFNAKRNGLIVDAEVVKDSIVLSQKTSTEIPGAEELWFGNLGNTMIYRSWNQATRTLDSFDGSIPVPVKPAYCSIPFSKILAKKEKGSEVGELQKYMNVKIGTAIPVDNVFSLKTYGLVKKLQEVLGIEKTGIYNQLTIDAINNDCALVQKKYQDQLQGIQKITGSFLSENISQGSVSPDGTQVFFLKPTSGGVVGIVANIDGTKQRQVWSSELSEWKPQWINQDTVALTTLASREADGYLYFLNLKNGNFKKILGPLRGLTTLTNPSGSMVLANSSTDTGMTLGSYGTKTGRMTVLDITTLPEKCTWANEGSLLCAVPKNIPEGQYPDDVYQGNVSFSDNFWFVDTEKNVNRLLLVPGPELDVIRPKTSPDNSYLYFINRTDGNLWSYRLSD